jgi:hypothetical protein
MVLEDALDPSFDRLLMMMMMMIPEEERVVLLYVHIAYTYILTFQT